MSGKKARQARREERDGLLVTLNILIEWESGDSGVCNVCKKHFEHCAKVALIDAYDTDPEVLEPLRGTTAGELQADEHMQRVMRRQMAGHFTTSMARPYCTQCAMNLVSGCMGNTAHGTMAGLYGVMIGRDELAQHYTAIVLYAEPGAWAPSVPSMVNGLGTPDLPAIYRIAARRRPNTRGPNPPGVHIINVED